MITRHDLSTVRATISGKIDELTGTTSRAQKIAAVEAVLCEDNQTIMVSCFTSDDHSLVALVENQKQLDPARFDHRAVSSLIMMSLWDMTEQFSPVPS